MSSDQLSVSVHGPDQFSVHGADEVRPLSVVLVSSVSLSMVLVYMACVVPLLYINLV